MFKKILVPTDGTPLSDKVIAAAVEFAKINPGSRILGLSVVVPMPFSPFDGLGGVDLRAHEKNLSEQASQFVEKLKTVADANGIPCETLVTQFPSPASEIVRVAKDSGCDCIFMSSHGRKGLNRLFLGSETQKVLAQATVPVMVYR